MGGPEKGHQIINRGKLMTPNDEKISYYDMVSDGDIIENFKPLLVTGGYRLRDEDGKICVTTPSLSWETPWHHIVHDHFLDCHRWHTIVFDLFSRVLPDEKSFVPSSCMNCWKVVVRPKSLLGLFSLMHLQMRLDKPSKCGIEIRPYVHGLYGGYFYNHSLQEGVECYKTIRAEVDQTPHLGEGVDVILKRACTEYEKKVGDSSKWEVTDRQLSIETMINKWFVRDNVFRTQPQYVISRVHKKWIEFAYANGDPTYMEFTGGKPLFRPPTTYHHLADSSEEERKEAFEKFDRKCLFSYDL